MSPYAGSKARPDAAFSFSPAAEARRDGCPGRQQATADIALAQLRPTVPEHDVHRHQHSGMHLVLLLAGRYAGDAAGMRDVCAEPALRFNPPGTEHRDRFKSRDGLFLTLTMPHAAYQRLVADLRMPDRAVRLDRRALSRSLRLLGELWNWDGASALVVVTTTNFNERQPHGITLKLITKELLPDICAGACALRTPSGLVEAHG